MLRSFLAPKPLLLLTLVAATATAESVPRSGVFHKGLTVEPLSGGAAQVHGVGSPANGVSTGAALQIDLGSHLALRLPVEFTAAFKAKTPALDDTPVKLSGYVDVAFSPEVLYRWRDQDRSRWTPYVGAGVRFVSVLAAAALVEVNGEKYLAGSYTKLGLSPAALAGLQFNVTHWLALNVLLEYSYLRVDHFDVHLTRERLGLQLTF